MTDLWLPQFTRRSWDPYGFGYACAYSGGKPTRLSSKPCGLLHSTEGPAPSSYDYRGGKDNPNFTIDPWNKKRYQHCPANVAARALRANNSQAVQFEIMGYCDKNAAAKAGKSAFYLPNLDAAGLQYLAESLQIVAGALGIPAKSTVDWLPYPASAGATKVRLSSSQFASYEGWLGHQHAPYPDEHGDPGLLWERLAPYMTTTPPVVPHNTTQQTALTAATVKALQKVLGLEQTGDLDKATITAWQKKIGTTADGVISDPSQLITDVQQYINEVLHWHMAEDGLCGPVTSNAIAGYLARNGAFTSAPAVIARHRKKG